MNQKKWTPGRFVWRELVVEDVDKAKGYYGELFGWKFEGMGPGDHYTVISIGDRKIGGIMRPPPDKKIPPCWMSYVSVEDVDAAVQRASANGGSVLMPPTDQQGVGRFAVIADPEGAAVDVIRFSDGDPAVAERPSVGTFCWETAVAHQPEKTKAFYEKVIGWKSGPVPGGRGILLTTADGAMAADIQNVPEVPPHWATYVVVENLEEAKKRTEKLGGKIIFQEVKVPGIGRFAVTHDPLGASICLFQGE